jgi:hypothetical protein
MSGITPESVMTVTLDGFGSGGTSEWYRLISFPSKVNITSIQLIMNGETRGTVANARHWFVGAVKGRQSNQTLPGVEPDDEDLIEFFGPNEKPSVHGEDGVYVSNVATPLAKPIEGDYEWYSYGPEGWGNGNYTGLVSQMDPDEYLMLYIDSGAGNFGGLDTDYTAATIVIGYEGCGSNL